MASLSWNEIRTRASTFILEWKDKASTAREEADAQTFENGFFNIFGISRAKVAIFEKKVKLTDGYNDLFEGTSNNKESVHLHSKSTKTTPLGATGYIDLLWKGHILIEMKTPGKDMQKAYEQAKNYANALAAADLPKGILICDFVTFHYYNLEEDGALYAFPLVELDKHIELFGYLAGYTTVTFKELDPVNIEAAEKMSRLHNHLAGNGYSGHQLEMYLVRILFCLFADDTGIFPHSHFISYILERTNPDGSDLALHLAKIFEILNKPVDKRLKNIDEQVNRFPFVNGGLFEEHLETADFDSKMRDTLIDCCTLDWSFISPAIFGAMFQSVMNDAERHDIGAHYTSEGNILKVIHPLFLDDLRAEFEKIKAYTSELRTERLAEFHTKLSKLKFLDPACGCGNFLIISYRELRLLEMDLIKELLGGTQLLDVDQYIKVNVNQFYGIEIEEFPAKIAQTALWLMDHQMNMQVRERFGQYFIRIPLKASATIINGNALTLDWESIIPPSELSYIMGNPPFLGARIMSKEQKKELEQIFGGLKNSSNLDYVCCWYKKAARYIRGTGIECAFVSTNSICQGEQVPILWQDLMNNGVKINFAHQTFKWSNEARGKAAVYCVIIGFSLFDRPEKKLYLYETVMSEPVETTVRQINQYLIDASTVFIEVRHIPICNVPKMYFGNQPIDGGFLLLSEDERREVAEKEPDMLQFVRRYVGSDEFINNTIRYCLWLKGVEPNELRQNSLVTKRIKKVKDFRLSSVAPSTRKLADFPALFASERHPETEYIIVPSVSSEKRKYVPIGFMPRDVVASNLCLIIPGGTIYNFGILTSTMHMAWMRQVCGRLKSDYRYSATIVYNNFPWPTPTEKQRKTIETVAQAVLDARALFPTSSLADLYDPTAMPPELVKAHQKLDKAVEAAYGRTFDDDSQRVAYLFELYQKLAGELFAETKKRRRKGRKK
ncbi:methylase [Spirochaetia bacterium]|nr:methylase [Spirochaetia bacterium]